MGRRNHVLDTVHIGAIWRIQLNRPCAAGDAALCQITYLRLSLGRWYTSAARALVYSVPMQVTGWKERVTGRDVILRLNGTLNANCGNQSARSCRQRPGVSDGQTRTCCERVYQLLQPTQTRRVLRDDR